MQTDTVRTMSIAFIGFGEAAAAFVEGWKRNGGRRIWAYDIKTDQSRLLRSQKQRDYARAGISGCESAGECAAKTDIIFSMVTTDQALAAAHSASNGIDKGALYLDCNTCAPHTKKQAATLIEEAGGRYVDVAVMAPVYPALHQTPVLVSGQWAEEAVELMASLEMVPTLIEGEVGAASSIKLIRSVMVKGMEALVCECVLAARKAGVEEIVLASLEKTYPGINWKDRSGYMMGRMMTHGVRRAAEMREVAVGIEQLGLGNSMSRSAASWQQTIGELQLVPGDNDYQARADVILSALAQLTNQEN
jgi:3-hydroxyisobutyrate dehydrogenase-like beta-hydroxyacid dehydrogenase